MNILAEESQGALRLLRRRAVAAAALGLLRRRLHAQRAGLPVLDAGVAHLECDVERTLDGGDHTIYLGARDRTRR